MNRQCEARTAKRSRCRDRATQYRRVQYSDGVREFLVCACHAKAIDQQSFAPAVSREPITQESAA
jgi:hypothetical protein